jgi:predicted HicB family RNase H-like nuclease
MGLIIYWEVNLIVRKNNNKLKNYFEFKKECLKKRYKWSEPSFQKMFSQCSHLHTEETSDTSDTVNPRILVHGTKPET